MRSNDLELEGTALTAESAAPLAGNARITERCRIPNSWPWLAELPETRIGRPVLDLRAAFPPLQGRFAQACELREFGYGRFVASPNVPDFGRREDSEVLANGFMLKALALVIEELQTAFRATADGQVDLEHCLGIAGSVLELVGVLGRDDRLSVAQWAHGPLGRALSRVPERVALSHSVVYRPRYSESWKRRRAACLRSCAA